MIRNLRGRVNGKDRQLFDQLSLLLKKCVNGGVWKIYNTGNVENDYRSIFETPDLTANPEILWFGDV